LWYLFGDDRLSADAAAFVNEAAQARQNIAVSSITLAEIVYLVEKGRLPVAVYEDIKKALADPEHVFIEAVFTSEIVDAMRRVARAEVPDMPDRMIAATALHFNVPVMRANSLMPWSR
jgi:predicted nucleic acid-binding protein